MIAFEIFVVTIAFLIQMSYSLSECDTGAACIYVSKNNWVVQSPSKIKPQYPPISKSWSEPTTTLFVMIASFRDRLCPITLFNMYTKAKYPSRITAGVVQQNMESDIDCFKEYCRLMKQSPEHQSITDNSLNGCPYAANIRMLRVNATESKGPTWGRAKGSTLLRDEEFCMQTDAHMDFVRDWDTHMLQMWADTKNEYGILSTYVTEASALRSDGYVGGPNGINNLHEVPHLCMVTFEGAHGMIRNWGTKCARMLPEPKLTNAIWGAGLSFSKCHAERKVPYDPHTPHIFDGEEFSRAARFFTYGYDIYTPHRVYVVHDYHKSQADPTHMSWTFNTKDMSQGTIAKSVTRLKMLLMLPPHNSINDDILALHQSRYGLGDRRTIDQLIEFSGVDTKHRQSLGNRCGNIEYVPFEQHPFGADYIPLFDLATEKYIDVRDPGSIYYSANMSALWKEREMAYKANKPFASLPATRVVGASDKSLERSNGNSNSHGGMNSAISTHDNSSKQLYLYLLLGFIISCSIGIAIYRRNHKTGNSNTAIASVASSASMSTRQPSTTNSNDKSV